MRRFALVTAALAVLVLVTGCGDDEKPAPSGTKTIDITFSDGSVTPQGERIDVQAGQPVELLVKADEAGEIHVHSSPEQELEYGEGTTSLKLTIDKPGIVEVESHTLEKTILQLEVK
jgi:hypothetical protein